MSGYPEAHSAAANLATANIDPVTARAAAVFVAGRLGPDCRDVLEALGLVSYAGHNTTAGHVTPVPRWGVLA